MNSYEKTKALAEKAGKSIAAVEAEAKIANGTISGWKTGRPYAETLAKVAAILECSIEDLIADKD